MAIRWEKKKFFLNEIWLFATSGVDHPHYGNSGDESVHCWLQLSEKASQRRGTWRRS